MKKTFWKSAVKLSAKVGLILLAGLFAMGCQRGHEFSTVDPRVFDATAATNAPGIAIPGVLSKPIQTGNRFAIGDQVTVKFSGTTDQNLKDHQEHITENGTITLPYIGSVNATGKTAGELQAQIHDRYVPDYYKYLTVTVMGEQRVYYVGGHVRTPGRQAYIGSTTVTKAIQSAGDFDDFAARRRVVLTRANGETFEVDCIKATRNPSLDLPVYPSDQITVDLRRIFDLD